MMRRPVLLTLVLATAAVSTAGGLVGAQGAPPSTGEVATFGGNAQHTAVFEPAATDLNAIRWSTTIDRRETFTNAHYGSPLVTASNTVIVPVKTQGDGFEIRFFDGRSGEPRRGTATSDYVLPAHNWIPVYQPALASVRDSRTGPVRERRLYFPGVGGTLFYLVNPDNRLPFGGRQSRVAFFGLDAFERDKAGFTSTVFVNTPLTADSLGNVFFGFRVQGSAPAPLSTNQSGFARIAPDGSATYVLAGIAAGDGAITRDTHNSAPALSHDEQTLYVVAKAGTTNAYAYLLGLDARTLQTKFKVFLKDPRNNRINNASVSDDSTASPMIAPDGDVYFGILANPNNGSRGFLLRFSADLTVEKTPGGFGWDSTAAIVPASMVPSYPGPSAYLIFTKYNNYRFGDGDGVNRIALLDPNTTQVDPHPSAGGLVQMREVLTVIGPTPDATSVSTTFPNAVREWCINTAAVNPATKSIFVPNEDGRIYRWDLTRNSLSQGVVLNPGFGQPYVPTIIGPDGTVFTLNGGTLFALGKKGNLALTLTSSAPDVSSTVERDPVTFTAGGVRNWLNLPIGNGTIAFTDVYYPHGNATPIAAELGRVPFNGGQVEYSTSLLAAGTHFITATHDRTGASATLVQKVHAFSTSISAGVTTTVITAQVTSAGGGATGMVTLSIDGVVINQLPLDASGVAAFNHCMPSGSHSVHVRYASDTRYASSSATSTWFRGSPCPGS
jgi:hypothetical protein